MIKKFFNRKMIRETFGKYVPKEALDDILSGKAYNKIKFRGIGTVFESCMIILSELPEQVDPQDLIDILNRYRDHVVGIIMKHMGFVLEFAGDTVFAYWHPEHSNPNHAQLAFDASREILVTLPELIVLQQHLPYDVEIVLGTGDMAGDFFGPIKQFQVVGKAMAIADRLTRIRGRPGSSIRMSQYTLDLIDTQGGIEETGIIKRDDLEDLKIFTYRSSS